MSVERSVRKKEEVPVGEKWQDSVRLAGWLGGGCSDGMDGRFPSPSPPNLSRPARPLALPRDLLSARHRS
jgi:hypothetical protein